MQQKEIYIYVHTYIHIYPLISYKILVPIITFHDRNSKKKEEIRKLNKSNKENKFFVNYLFWKTPLRGDEKENFLC